MTKINFNSTNITWTEAMETFAKDNNLLKSIKLGTRLIIVGDVDQLPSVGAGNVLKDLINSDIRSSYRHDKK